MEIQVWSELSKKYEESGENVTHEENAIYGQSCGSKSCNGSSKNALRRGRLKTVPMLIARSLLSGDVDIARLKSFSKN